MLPIGILGYTVFGGWAVKKEIMHAEFNNKHYFKAWYFILRYVAPILVIIIIIAECFPAYINL